MQKDIKIQDPFKHSAIPSSQPESDYDLIIACDRLRDLNPSSIRQLSTDHDIDDNSGGVGIDGWDMTINPTNLWNKADRDGFMIPNEFLFDKPNENIKRIAVTGIYNVGKTYILRNLSEEKLPDEGSQVRTRGLSIKQFKNQPDVIVMDSAGKNSTIEMTDEMSLSDKICSEKILENTIFELANYHICVVNELTWPDQHHFEMLYDKIHRAREESNNDANQQFPLVVIHNFKDKTLQQFYNENLVEQVQLAYQKGILRCSNKNIKDGEHATREFQKLLQEFINEGTKSSIFKRKNSEEIRQYFTSSEFPDFWFDSRKKNTTNSVKHYFLVKSDEIGAAFNYFVFEAIRKEYIKAPTNNKIFCLNDILRALDQQTKRFVKLKKNNGEILIPSSDANRTNIGCVGQEKEGKQIFKLIINPDLIKDQENEWSLVKLRKPHELEYNALYVAATEWIPKYDVQYTEDGKMCKVFLEMPGKIEEPSVTMDENDPSKLVISGARIKDDEYEKNEGTDDQMGRIFSGFNFKIKLKDDWETPTWFDIQDGIAKIYVTKKSPSPILKPNK